MSRSSDFGIFIPGHSKKQGRGGSHTCGPGGCVASSFGVVSVPVGGEGVGGWVSHTVSCSSCLWVGATQWDLPTPQAHKPTTAVQLDLARVCVYGVALVAQLPE
jgi:hypothetical protein